MMERFRFWLEDHVTGRMAAVILLGLAVFMFWLGSQYQQWQGGQAPLLISVEDQESEKLLFLDETKEGEGSQRAQKIVVHVVGAVERPGVYELMSDGRVQDAVSLAGLAANADPDQLNLARSIHDGEKIMVPAQGEAGESLQGLYGPSSTAGEAETKVSINQANHAELMTLPSVGEVRAQAIIAYREEHGAFQQLEELKNVSGIGEKTFAQLEPLIRL